MTDTAIYTNVKVSAFEFSTPAAMPERFTTGVWFDAIALVQRDACSFMKILHHG